MNIFHERLKELIKTRGKKQIELAEALEITPQALSYYINGREPSFDLLVKISNYFNVSTDYMLGLSLYENKALLYSKLNIAHRELSRINSTIQKVNKLLEEEKCNTSN